MPARSTLPLVCCRPVVEEALTAEEADGLAAAFRVLGDPVRLRLLSMVAAATAQGEEVCACDLPSVLGRSQPTISHHLAVLTQAGLLRREQRGKWAWFRAEPERLAALAAALGGAAAAVPVPAPA
ncbi:MAG TPA: metalloregulator ArsR/SmtB family transcription factor [Acidimicrobiales bacterium]|jgi:ArsR family transcriptional regulator